MPPVGKLAKIKLGIGIAPRYCLVTNVSPEGVRNPPSMDSKLSMSLSCFFLKAGRVKAARTKWSGETA